MPTLSLNGRLRSAILSLCNVTAPTSDDDVNTIRLLKAKFRFRREEIEAEKDADRDIEARLKALESDGEKAGKSWSKDEIAGERAMQKEEWLRKSLVRKAMLETSVIKWVNDRLRAAKEANKTPERLALFIEGRKVREGAFGMPTSDAWLALDALFRAVAAEGWKYEDWPNGEREDEAIAGDDDGA